MASRFEPYRRPVNCIFATAIAGALWVALVVAVLLKT